MPARPPTPSVEAHGRTVEEPGRTRAVALPASERRAAIVAATLPLVLAHGAAVTTRQIAEAAGIAEGTIFRVFPDKEHLIEAVAEAAYDTKPVDDALAAIDRALPLEDRLVLAVDILRLRFATILQVRTAVEMMRVSSGVATKPDRHRTPDLRSLALLFEPDRAQLRHAPMDCAFLLRGLTLAGSHPALIAGEPLSSEEIVSLFLDGVRAHDHDATANGNAAC
jgi:AcrR family transcriptional regulator